MNTKLKKSLIHIEMYTEMCSYELKKYNLLGIMLLKQPYLCFILKQSFLFDTKLCKVFVLLLETNCISKQ